jgi:hypothetical protein
LSTRGSPHCIGILWAGTGWTLAANRLRRNLNAAIDQVEDIITVAEFYARAASGEIVFT